MTWIHGDILYTKDKDDLVIHEDSYMGIENGLVTEVVKERPEGEIIDRKGHLILPTFVDAHFHAPQYANCGLGTDVELLEWLEKYTYPEEVKYKDLKYSETLFKSLINKMWECGTLRSSIFSSLYTEATDLLFKLLIQSGLSAYVGKVNMDDNAPGYYRQTVEETIEGNKYLIEKYKDEPLVKPILTPRFAPHCTRESMKAQGEMAKEYDVPVQSHMNESVGEIEFVKELYGEDGDYADTYDRYGLFGSNVKTLMAHCIHNTEHELKLMKERNLYPVHCPESNANITSGIMPARKMLEMGIPVAMGSDISGGNHLYMGNQVLLAIQLSKMRGRLLGDLSDTLSISEAYYMATKSGGSFFGKVGSLEPGYEADFLVVETDSLLVPLEERSIWERFQKFIYIGGPDNIQERYLQGKRLEKPFS